MGAEAVLVPEWRGARAPGEQYRLVPLDGVDLVTGRSVTLDAAQCAFGYRDSIFKHLLAGKTLSRDMLSKTA